jgi:hypothetical protein
MAAGYSQRALVEKLGIKPGARIVLLNAPAGYDQILGPLPPGAAVLKKLGRQLDFIQFFASDRGELEGRFGALKGSLAAGGMLWVCWPKRAAKVPTDLTEDVVREVGLAHGLVDVKVCAVDEQWSGLKFVFRLRDRGGKP